MIGAIVGLGLAVFLALKPLPDLTTPAQVGHHYRCDPAGISYYISGRITYKSQGPFWITGDECLARKNGDCKCFSIVARDALLACGYNSQIIIADNPKTKAKHAFTIFYNDRIKGFIDQNNYRTYSLNTSWDDITADVGPYVQSGEVPTEQATLYAGDVWASQPKK